MNNPTDKSQSLQQDLIQLLKIGENEQIEFKKSFDKEAVESLSSFANTKGGCVLIGVEDNGVVKGLGVPVFEELQEGFRVVVDRIPPPNSTRSEGVSEGANEGVNSLYNYIRGFSGVRIPELSQKLSVPVKTLERWIKQLRDDGKVVFRGASKTGGYHVVGNDGK